MTDHVIQVRYTKDAGNWTAFRDLNAGATGAFGKELVTRQLGQATWRVWETCDTSDFAADILAAAILAANGNWSDFPLPDGSYSDLTRDWTQQDLENYIPLPAQQAGTRSRVLYRTAPGMEVFANIGSGPHRGAISVEGTLFVVSGTALYEVASNGTATNRGTIPGTGRVCMAYNQITDGNQLVVGNGSSGYVYNTVTADFSQIADDGFAGFKSCDFLNQYIVGVEPLGRFWYHSELVDALSYNTLDRYGAETSPDAIQGLVASHNEVLVFGARTIEPWVNDPENNAAGTAFQLQRGSVIERGCINGNTIRRLDNSVFFVGDDRVPYRLNGYTPVPIGTPVLAAAWRDLNPAKAFAFTYEDRGHVVYYVTWGDGQTWGYDVVTGKWHRRQSFGLNRWRLNTLVKWGNEWVGGDFQTGKLYRLAWGFVYEGCEIMPRRIRTGVLHADGNPVTVAGFKVVASTGGEESVASAEVAPTIAGTMPDYNVGDTVDFQYTITTSYPGQQYTITASGLPDGTSIDAMGRVTGTATTANAYAITLTLTTGCASRSYSDVVIVSALTSEWIAVQSLAAGGTNGLYVSSNDLASWGTSTTRSPYIEDANYPKQLGAGAVVNGQFNTGSGLLERFTDFNYADGVTTTSVTVNASDTIYYLRYISGIGFCGTNGGKLYKTLDQGATWSLLLTSIGGPIDIARLGDKWISFNIAGTFKYSDDLAIWHDSSFSSPQIYSPIVCTTAAAVVFDTLNGYYRTTDGAAWAHTDLGYSHDISPGGAISVNGVMLFKRGGSPGLGTRILRSTDHGVTFSQVTIDAAHDDAVIKFAYGNGITVAMCNSRVYKSTDNGATWTEVTMPNGGGHWGIEHITHA
jgi:hypothetical protein